MVDFHYLVKDKWYDYLFFHLKFRNQQEVFYSVKKSGDGKFISTIERAPVYEGMYK